MELRGHQVKACISPIMATNAEHNVICIPEDTRNKLDVTTGQRIRIKNRYFTVRQTRRADLDLIAMEPVINQDECVLFSTDHWRDEEFTDLRLRTGQVVNNNVDIPVVPVETDEEPAPIEPQLTPLEQQYPGSIVKIQGHPVVVCAVTGAALNKDRIGVPKALRDMFGVSKGDVLPIDDFTGRFIVDPCFKNDLEIYKIGLKETEMILVNPADAIFGDKVKIYSKAEEKAAAPVNKVNIDDIIKKIEEVVGPKSVVVDVSKIVDKNKEEIYTIDLTWSGEFVCGRANGYNALEAAKNALADLQKNLISLVEDTNSIVETLNELNETIQ